LDYFTSGAWWNAQPSRTTLQALYCGSGLVMLDTWPWVPTYPFCGGKRQSSAQSNFESLCVYNMVSDIYVPQCEVSEGTDCNHALNSMLHHPPTSTPIYGLRFI
jgi:hypothetical protein